MLQCFTVDAAWPGLHTEKVRSCCEDTLDGHKQAQHHKALSLRGKFEEGVTAAWGPWLKHDMQLKQRAATETSAGRLEVASLHSAVSKGKLPLRIDMIITHDWGDHLNVILFMQVALAQV